MSQTITRMIIKTVGDAYVTGGFIAFVVSLLIFSPMTTGATDSKFSQLYDYYFPKHGNTVRSSFYRPFFDKTLFGAPLSTEYRERSRQLYYAFRNDPVAFRWFLHNADREGEGEFSEEWNCETALLLLRLGDERFLQLLAREDNKTRELVGQAIDPQIDWSKHQFPKTHALYSYRYKRALN